MELRRYLAILRRRVLLILLTVAVAVGVTVATADTSSSYTAVTSLYVGASSYTTPSGASPNLSGDQLSGLARLINTFAAMIKSGPIAADALERTGVPRSSGLVVAETYAGVLPDTNILVITVTDADPSVAQRLSIGLAEAFVQKISELEPATTTAEGAIPSAPARIFERARLPVVPKKASNLSNVLIAGLFGLLLSGGLVLLVEYLDITVKSPEDAEQRLELPVIAAVPFLSLDPSTTLRRPPTARREQIGLVRDA